MIWLIRALVIIGFLLVSSWPLVAIWVINGEDDIWLGKNDPRP